MANMVTSYYCPDCDTYHKVPPYHGYVLGVDLATDEQGEFATIVVAKAFPDLEGGVDYVILDVIRQRPEG